MGVLRPFSRLARGLWFVPLACVLAGVALSLGTIAIDRAFDYELVPHWISGGPDAAMEILGTVAASMVSLAALVLTITMVVVQASTSERRPGAPICQSCCVVIAGAELNSPDLRRHGLALPVHARHQIRQRFDRVRRWILG